MGSRRPQQAAQQLALLALELFAFVILATASRDYTAHSKGNLDLTPNFGIHRIRPDGQGMKAILAGEDWNNEYSSTQMEVPH